MYAGYCLTGFHGLWGFLFVLTIAVSFSIVIYSLLKMRNNLFSKTVNETPAEILNKRYAKGELTKEDFERMKKDINS